MSFFLNNDAACLWASHAVCEVHDKTWMKHVKHMNENNMNELNMNET